MYKINKIFANLFTIIGVLKILILIAFAMSMFLSFSVVLLNVFKYVVMLLQLFMIPISVLMIINNISIKSKTWIGYVFSFLGVLTDYFLPTATIFVLAKNILSGYLYYMSGRLINKFSLNNETCLLSKPVRILNYVYSLCICLLVILAGVNIFALNCKKDYKEIDLGILIEEPLQKEYSNTKVVTKNNRKYKIDFIASYDITGRVTNTHYYFNSEPFSLLSPIDVTLSWGENAIDENHNSINYYSIGDRKVYSSYSYDVKYISSEMSNNHLIPANEQIGKEIMLIRRDDYVRLEGYLVNVTSGNWYTNTSTVRTDNGDGACEVLYVTNVTWLKDK